jgi:hypothetical protein
MNNMGGSRPASVQRTNGKRSTASPRWKDFGTCESTISTTRSVAACGQAGVSFEDRQDLLGRRSGRITTHYSQAELSNLIAAAEKVCGDEKSRNPPATTWLRRRVNAVSL